MKIIFRLSYNCSHIGNDKSGGHELTPPFECAVSIYHTAVQLFSSSKMLDLPLLANGCPWVQHRPGQTQTPDPP